MRKLMLLLPLVISGCASNVQVEEVYYNCPYSYDVENPSYTIYTKYDIKTNTFGGKYTLSVKDVHYTKQYDRDITNTFYVYSDHYLFVIYANLWECSLLLYLY